MSGVVQRSELMEEASGPEMRSRFGGRLWLPSMEREGPMSWLQEMKGSKKHLRCEGCLRLSRTLQSLLRGQPKKAEEPARVHPLLGRAGVPVWLASEASWMLSMTLQLKTSVRIS